MELRRSGASRAASGLRYNPAGTPVIETPTQLNPDNRASATPKPARRAFSSFSNGDFRIYFLSSTAAMMADNVEHVISYWVIFQKFHSPALGGFAVISHWVRRHLVDRESRGTASHTAVHDDIGRGFILFCRQCLSGADARFCAGFRAWQG